MLLSLLKEKVSLWEKLRNTKKPIVLYGMGDGADKVLGVLSRYGAAAAGVFASDGFVRGQSFRGFRVERLSDIEERLGDFIVLVCFATCLPDVLDSIGKIAKRHELYAPSVPVCGGTLCNMDFLKENEDSLDKIYGLLADERSRETFLNVLDYKVSGKIEYLRACESPRAEIYVHLKKRYGGGYFVDCGAYDGDTVEEFLHWTNFEFDGILAIEPDRRSFKKLTRKIDNLGLKNARCINAGVWDKRETLCFSQAAGRQNRIADSTGQNRDETLCDSVDNFLAEARAAVIKYDVEGAETQALLGSRKTIERDFPALMISAYHREEDLFELPLLAISMRGDYRLYLRRPAYMPAWDLTFLLV